MTFRTFLCAMVVTVTATFAQQGSPKPAPDFEQMNQAFGIPIWQDDNLWENPAAEVASRLHWPEESHTSIDASYRLYPPRDARVLGMRPFSLMLYSVHDKPSSVSMVFANKGDADEMSETRKDPSDRRVRDIARECKKFIQEDAEAIQKKLTELLGAPQSDRYGQGRDTREQVKRWDWKGHSILLANPRDEYVAVRIVPTASLEGTPANKMSDPELREKLQTRIERRENGDVVLKDIPMVDQGPKGYCVPATWERVLRYMGIPADMYILAMAGKTDMGGGTSLVKIANGANSLVLKNGRRLVQENGKVQMRNVAKSIDKGLPIMWTMEVNRDLERRISDRTLQRGTTTDWPLWKKSLDPFRKAARSIKPNPMGAHMRMIIGYNEKTGEIAMSDSWGKNYEERWITEEEADAVNGGSFMIINW